MNDNIQYNSNQSEGHDNQVINGQVVTGHDHSVEAATEANTEFLAQNTNKIVSEGGAGAQSITKLLKQGGDVVGYELSNGSRVSVEQAIQMASDNQLQHVGVSTSKAGTSYLRSLADDDESNNLGNLPSETV